MAFDVIGVHAARAEACHHELAGLRTDRAEREIRLAAGEVRQAHGCVELESNARVLGPEARQAGRDESVGDPGRHAQSNDALGFAFEAGRVAREANVRRLHLLGRGQERVCGGGGHEPIARAVEQSRSERLLERG